MAQGHKCVIVNKTGCVFDANDEMKYLIKFIFSFFRSVVETIKALSSSTQNAMPPQFGGKWGTECLITSFPLPTLMCAKCSVKIEKNSMF